MSLKDCRSYLVFIAFNWQNELRFNSFILLLKWVTMIILHVAFILLINKFKKAMNFIKRNMALYCGIYSFDRVPVELFNHHVKYYCSKRLRFWLLESYRDCCWNVSITREKRNAALKEHLIRNGLISVYPNYHLCCDKTVKTRWQTAFYTRFPLLTYGPRPSACS